MFLLALPTAPLRLRLTLTVTAALPRTAAPVAGATVLPVDLQVPAVTGAAALRWAARPATVAAVVPLGPDIGAAEPFTDRGRAAVEIRRFSAIRLAKAGECEAGLTGPTIRVGPAGWGSLMGSGVWAEAAKEWHRGNAQRVQDERAPGA